MLVARAMVVMRGASSSAVATAGVSAGDVNICWHLGHLIFLPPGTGTGDLRIALQWSQRME